MREHFATFLRDSIWVTNNILESRTDRIISEYIEVLSPTSQKESQRFKDILSLTVIIKDLVNNEIYYKAPDVASPIFPYQGTGLQHAKHAIEKYCGYKQYADVHHSIFLRLGTVLKNNYSINKPIIDSTKEALCNIIEANAYNQSLIDDINEFLENPIDLFWLKNTDEYELECKILKLYRKLITSAMENPKPVFYKIISNKQLYYEEAKILANQR